MNIERQSISGDGFDIPSITITPSNSTGSVLIVHGYGGNKEEMIGLAYRVAEIGITACVIDLRGHGENKLPFDENILLDVETAVKYFQGFGKVVAIGHSLGGRLALLSSADYVIGISPAFNKVFGNQTKQTIKSLRSYRVQEVYPDVLFETLNKLPEFDGSKNAHIIYGSRDVPEIIAASNKLKEKGTPVTEIDKALHSDIFFVEATFEKVIGQIKEWI